MSTWCVYVLRSLKNGRHYTGSTDDIDRRVEEHQRGKNRYTRYAGPFELVYTEAADSRLEARRRERFLKTGQGREELRRILEERDKEVGTASERPDPRS